MKYQTQINNLQLSRVRSGEFVVISECSVLVADSPGNKQQGVRITADLLINLPCSMMQSHPALAAIQTLMDHRANHLPSWVQGTDWEAEIILALSRVGVDG